MVAGARRAGRKSIIDGLLALSTVLTGTGYAYWTDTLDITTRTTMGSFGMTSTNLGLYAQCGNEITPNGWNIVDGIDDKAYANDILFMKAVADYNRIAHGYSIDTHKGHQRGYSSVEFSVEFEKPKAIAKNVGPYNAANTKDSHQINITINQMYPGYIQAFRTDVLNVSSIATKLSNLKFSVKGFEDNGKAADMLGIALYMDGEQYHPMVNEGEPVFKLVNSSAGEGDYFTVGGVGFIRLSALKKLSNEEIRKVITNATILYSPATDNRMDLLLVVVVDPDVKGVYTTGPTTVLAKSDDKTSQKRAAEVSIGFFWDQFDTGKDAGNLNHLMKQNKSEKR